MIKKSSILYEAPRLELLGEYSDVILCLSTSEDFNFVDDDEFQNNWGK